ncbi:MAG: hypothetical protein A2854_04500 [Parcubacteria group bacterium RIFCSPHIGHO2_01_FULL_56_18]|nr:MAG: hypothetical protein A2854_04500 [Parcubacteria group bacterium RIFCSPHIGHO2_01_FULL_56_18]
MNTFLSRSNGWVAAVVAAVTVFALVGVVQASTTISTNISTGGTLSVTGASTLTGAVSAASTLAVTGVSTLTGGVAVGATANTVTDMSIGYCTIPATTVTASSTAYADCTTSVTISASDRVVVQATSSLPANFLIQAASTTGATTINVRIFNSGTIAGTATGINSFNFWAAR